MIGHQRDGEKHHQRQQAQGHDIDLATSLFEHERFPFCNLILAGHINHVAEQGSVLAVTSLHCRFEPLNELATGILPLRLRTEALS